MKRKSPPLHFHPAAVGVCLGKGEVLEKKSRVRGVGDFRKIYRIMSKPTCQQNKDKVRRRLTFDEPDNQPPTSPDAKHETDARTANEVNNILDLSTMTQLEKMEKMKQWNFDFENEIPLEGDWEWTSTRTKPTTDHKEVIKNLEADKDRVGDRNV